MEELRELKRALEYGYIRGDEVPVTWPPVLVVNTLDAAILDVHDNGWLSRIHGRLLDFVSQPPSTRYAYLPELIVGRSGWVAKVVQEGLDHPWDIAVADDGRMLVTERIAGANVSSVGGY